MSAPIRIGHPDPGFAPDSCHCCEGTALATLQPTENRPNLSAIVFRVGDHAQFKASMLTSLASTAYPALANLRTREDDDFSIALIDAWASACDVLTFYQERLANEAYIGTATERLSIGELARLIGYRLHPGAAAETDLVILMEDPPGAKPDVADLVVPVGTRVQSQPGPDELPQVFETIADLEARVAWNTLRPRLTQPVVPSDGARSAWVAGTPSLQVGDAIVFITRERWDEDFSGFDEDTLLWDFRRVTAVQPAADGSRTRIRWNKALDSVDNGAAPTPGLKLFHLRDRAALFGYNAPHPRSLSSNQRTDFGFVGDPADNSPSRITGDSDDPGDWQFLLPGGNDVHLDNIYKSFVEGGWMVMQAPNAVTQPFRIDEARDDTLAKYAISGKAQRLTLDTDANFDFFEDDYRQTTVYGGSVEIALAETPLTEWVAGNEIELDIRVHGLPEGRKLVLRGKRACLEVTGQSISITSDDGAIRGATRGAIVTLLDEPVPWGATDHRLRLMDQDGFAGLAIEPLDAFEAVPAPDDAEEIAVSMVLEQALATDNTHSTLVLNGPLGLAFDRTSLRIHANVARAAHGEGVTEILGHGDPARPFQKFQLKQAPVTQRLAGTETGIESTLSVRIDGVEWEEVPDLYQRGATARVYKTSLTDSGETVIEFGDGISGARPPAGRDNVVANHSRGLGAAGNLRSGQLKLPLDRPLGLKETDNPLPAAGGADAEIVADSRRNAPIYTLTLGRVVSLTDYRDFALGFPGIAKAEARWIWQGEARRIVVTVAGSDGQPVEPGSTTHTNLLDAFRSLGDPLVGVDLLSYASATFRLGLKVKVGEAYDGDAVLSATEAALREAFSFEARSFGEMLSLSEVAAVAHRIEGLEAVDIDLLYRTTAPQTATVVHARLISQGGRLGPGNVVLPAEILTLDEGSLDKLELMA